MKIMSRKAFNKQLAEAYCFISGKKSTESEHDELMLDGMRRQYEKELAERGILVTNLIESKLKEKI